MDIEEERNTLPPCPKCGNGQYNTRSGGDSTNDPYPDRKQTPAVQITDSTT